MREYKYQKQKKDHWCGAACLSMVYSRYSINYTQEKIYSDIKSDNSALEVVEIVNHVNKHSSLFACAVRFKSENIKDFLKTINNSCVDMIMNHKERNSNSAHFTLFAKVSNETVYGFDPYCENNFPLPISELDNLWQRNEKLEYAAIAGYTAILISDDNELFSHVSNKTCGHNILRINIDNNIIHRILCCECNVWRNPQWDTNYNTR